MLPALYLCVAAAISVRVAGNTVDDFFITFRYATNLATGKGFVFNPGELVLATTAPGWALLLSGAHLLTSIAIPVLATFGSGFALALVATLLLREAAESGRATEAAVGGFLVLLDPFFWTHNGSETPVALALIVLAARWLPQRPALSGLLAGYAVWCRPDTILLLAPLGLEAIRVPQDRRFRVAARFLVLAAALIAFGMLVSWVSYGTAVPETLTAKRFQAAWRPDLWRSGLDFWGEGYRWLSAARSGTWTPLFVLLGLAGLAPLARVGRIGSVLAASVVLHLLAYPLLGVPFYTWYLLPLVVGLAFGTTAIVGAAVRFFLKEPRRLARAALAVAAIVCGVLSASQALRRMAYGYVHFAGIPRVTVYREAGLWLRDHSAPDATVAFTEVGLIGVYSDRTTIDLLGLTQPRSLDELRSHGVLGVFERERPDFLLFTPRLAPLLQEVVERVRAAGEYVEVATFEDGPERLTVFRRVEAWKPPEPGRPLEDLTRDPPDPDA